MKITAALIVKNEEEMLASCLDSIQGVDEIVVCDTGSEDKTVEIARRYTDKVFTDYKWNDSFAEARNQSLSKVSKDTDWVLTVDADETIDFKIDRLREVLKDVKDGVFIDCKVISKGGKTANPFPRIYKYDDNIRWHGVAHNYLRDQKGRGTYKKAIEELRFVYGYSPAHKKDPDRTLRILSKAVESNPQLVRERYYLAREYYYRKDWQRALEEYDVYLKVARWLPEKNDAWLMRAYCLANLKRYNEACDSAWQALKYNANFKEALIFIGNHMDAVNKERWLSFAEKADNRNVLFIRINEEKGASYYDDLFNKHTDFSRYRAIYERIAEIVGKDCILDIGCGPATLSDFVDCYAGFDFAGETVKKVKARGVEAWEGNALDKENYKKAKYYVATEVLEHIEDDKKVLENIPKGSKVILSVPSFEDPSHVRTFTEDTVRIRYKDLIDIKKITVFNWIEKKWKEGSVPTEPYILLVEGRKVG